MMTFLNFYTAVYYNMTNVPSQIEFEELWIVCGHK